MDPAWLKAHVRDILDYPKPGIVFQGHHAAARRARTLRGRRSTRWPRRSPTSTIDKVIGIEARGFVFAAPVAYRPRRRIRPRAQARASCRGRSSARSTSSSTAPISSRSTATRSRPGERVLIVDDVIATGGTAAATARLVERLGGEVVGFAFVLELGFLARPRAAHGLPRPHGGDL